MRHFLLLTCCLYLLLSCESDSAPGTDSRPNIILIMADDLGYSDLGAYGGEIHTPHLDRLAAEGIQFTQFYNNAKCTESRAALLSGVYHHQTQNFEVQNHVTLAEVLREAGYATMMSGKWHLPENPLDRGFDRYFGFLVGAVNFYTGYAWGDSENPMRLDREVYTVPDDFYTTDAFTDYAIEFIDEVVDEDNPFFLYLAHNAPHFPLHAWPEDIEKYDGAYDAGWDELRAARYARMVEMDLIKPDWPLTPRDTLVPAWDTLSPEEQKEEAYLMAVYAAMVDRLDQNIGRLMEHLQSAGEAENTLVLFLSDNGACPWKADRTPDVAPGPADSYRTYNSEWANAGNTPFRLYKQYNHEGGTATPLIAYWPAGISVPGTRSDQVGHLIDFMPTLIELARATYPEMHNESRVLPMEGVSLTSVFQGANTTNRPPIYWEYRGNRAVRMGDWKLVAERSKDWELYNVVEDRTELRELGDTHPELKAELAAMYDVWAARAGAKTNEEGVATPASTQSRY